MRGLASSRHAPHPGQRFAARQHSTAATVFPPPSLTVTPAAALTGSTHDFATTETDPDRTTVRSPLTTQARNTSPSTLRHPHPQPTSSTSSAHELARYTRIIRRLQWKLPFLAQGYRLATTTAGAGNGDLARAGVVAEAELMFKLDFFEYYMLLERALVHLLGVFGVVVPRGEMAHDGGGGGGGVDGGGGEQQQQQRPAVVGLAASAWSHGHGGPRRHAARHRYHANVLAALDREDSPLRGTLGTGEVRRQLGRAKDLRNRWKTAGEEEGDEGGEEDEHVHRDHSLHHDRSPARSALSSPERQWRTKKVSAPLETYRLEHMLEVIFAGLDEAFKVAERYVRDGAEPGALGDADMLDLAAAADDEDQWEFMVEAMDWEAV